MAAVNRTEYAVLGLLALGARTGYDIKKMADEALGHFWNESFGHIYPILRRLDARGWVTSTVEPQEGRPDRKVYALTPAGEEALREWFAMPVEPVPPRNELLLKLFFAPLAPPADLRAQVEAHRELQREHLARLDALAEEVAREEAHNPSLPYWLLTVDYGRAALRALVAWSDDALARLDASPDSPAG
ncbi:MAG TPA: PadR family transcriptional regulator [Rubricoccaceae bacterium]|nr:PadR family transcriptional regulator [Rubricoccaceae bacterium]